jgi:tRNA dimethylallyltransferase
MASIDAILLCGPTASGKSAFALELAEVLPIEIVSVDSSQVYRGFDIGSAKPDRALRERLAHHLIDIRDPRDTYSAGEFVRDALGAIAQIRARGRWPLLVGGTMLYFNAFLRGMAALPDADPALRSALDARGQREGWPALHAELASVDPIAAARIHPQDSQRIQRALEVYRLSGRPLSEWQQQTRPAHALQLLRFALLPSDRAQLHTRITTRFAAMMAAGFLEEVRRLREVDAIPAACPALRAVGYRQLWAQLAGQDTPQQAESKALAATRQLAKRQMTWINADPHWCRIDPFAPAAAAEWVAAVQSHCR